jgi:hypothetical protein
MRGTAGGSISRGAVYTRPEFLNRAGLSEAAFAKARLAGLPVRRAGKRSFILGADFVDWVSTRPMAGRVTADSDD